MKERFSSSFFDVFDTASTVVAYDSSQSEFDNHLAEFHAMLEEYDHLYDIYHLYDGVANLCTLNETAKDGPVKVDERIIGLLNYAKEVYELSGGKTNIALGAVLTLWHEARTVSNENPENAYLPDAAQLKAAAAHTNIDDLVIDEENNTVYYADPQLTIDVGAIAKGYAVREVCRYAKENLWTSAAVSIGGNVCTLGYKNDDGKTLWNIEIENPKPNASQALLTVQTENMSIVTSGDYQRYFTVDGKQYCHIIDPETLMPSEYFSGVTVICDDSALGDALSTTLFNMPVEEGLTLIESIEGAEAVFVDREYRQTFSSGFEKYIKK